MGFEAAVPDPFDEVFQFLALRFAKQGDGGPFNRGVAGLNDFRGVQAGDEPYAFGSFDVEMASETASKIEDVDIFEVDSVAGEDGMQASDVSALGLGEFVYVAL